MATFNKHKLRPVQDFSLPIDHQIPGYETIISIDFSQAGSELANPTSQPQSDLPTNRESGQQEDTDSQIDFTITQDDSADDEPLIGVDSVPPLQKPPVRGIILSASRIGSATSVLLLIEFVRGWQFGLRLAGVCKYIAGLRKLSGYDSFISEDRMVNGGRGSGFGFE
ncbi:hypothetical protein BGZ79_009880, partial [Entomortierella chlamydospora]